MGKGRETEMGPNDGSAVPASIQVGEDDEEDAARERAPLTPQGEAGGGPKRRWSPVTRNDRRTAEIASVDASSLPDPRKTRKAKVLMVLLMIAPGLDLLMFVPQQDTSSLVTPEVERSMARFGRLGASTITFLIGAWAYFVMRKWHHAAARHIQVASAMFALLPEFMAICIVLDVGKLAYPAVATLNVVLLLMLIRLVSMGLVLSIALSSGSKRGLVGKKGLPDMLRTLITLESAEDASFSAIAVDAGAPPRPLSVALLEQLIVFLAPRKRGAVREGAGLARSSILPLLAFWFVAALGFSFAEYQRMYGSQEALLSAEFARKLYDAPAEHNEAQRAFAQREKTSLELFTPVHFKPLAAKPPPVTTYAVVLSGLRLDVANKILRPVFSAASNNMCSLDGSRCDVLRMRAELPTNSLPNWLALHTGATPAAHGLLGNRAPAETPMDSIAAVAAAHGVHMGASGAPWFVNPIKGHLPLLDGDGRVSSSDDATHETSASKSTEALD